MVIQAIFISILVDGLRIHAVGHADQLVAIFGSHGGGDVGVGVSIKGQHNRRI